MVCRLFVGLLILLNLTFPVKATEAFKKSDLTFDHFPFQNKPWVDLKLSQEYFDSSLPKKAETEPALHSLRRRIDAYHAINKTDKDLLLPRLNKLVKIQRTIKKVLETYPKLGGRHIGFHSPWRWQELERHVDNRCWYISQLYKLELQSPAEIFKNRLLPHFWEDGKVSRGLAGPWLSCQDLDPCHRGVGSLYREWYRWSSPGDPSYWMWLETQDTETMERKSPYSLEDVHLKTKTTFRKGKVKLDLMHHALEGEFLYVLDCDQNFHVYPLDLTTQTRSKDPKYDFWRSLPLRKHNQFLNGDPLICAGECTIQNGKIYEIDNNSGHYLPSPFNLRQCVEMLNHHQVLSDKGGVTIINGSEIIYKTFSQFLSSKPIIRTAFNSKALNQMSMHSLEKGFKKARKHQAAYLIQKAWKQFKAKEQEHRPAA